MSKLSNTAGAIALAGLTFLSGCRKDPASPSSGPTTNPIHPSASPERGLAELQLPNPTALLDDLIPQTASALSLTNYTPARPAIRSINSPEYNRTKANIDAFEKWMTSAQGAPVISRSTRRTPENDAAVRNLKNILNDYNSLVPHLHPGEKPWKPLNQTGNFNDSVATEAMVKRTEKLLGLLSSGKAGGEFFFAIRDALEEAYGVAPRLHKVLRASLLAENKSLRDSPNIDPLKRYPAIAKLCYEPSRRLIEPPHISADYKRNIQLVKEMQHCLIKLGYDFEVKNLKQSGVRDNATDEALKLFCRDFLQHKDAFLVDKALAYKLVSVATGFDFVLGATLNSEYNGNPYSKDPYKTYCGLTQVTLREWCADAKINPPALFDVKESLLRACYRQVFIVPSGCEHLLAMSAGPDRVKALELARAVADESYNRSPARALKTVAYALGVKEVEPDITTMTTLLHQGDKALQRLTYGRAFAVGLNGGVYEEGLGNRLKNSASYIASLDSVAVEKLVTRGIEAGNREQQRLVAVQKRGQATAKHTNTNKSEKRSVPTKATKRQ